MYKLLLLPLFIINGLFLNAQVVDNIPLKDLDVEYIEIILQNKVLSTKLYIGIDYGQPTTLFSSGTESTIKDSEGKTIEFNSIASALNFMYKNGFEFVSVYTVKIDESRNIIHYLLRKRKVNQSTENQL